MKLGSPGSGPAGEWGERFMRRGRFGLKLIGMGLALALLSACGGGERGRNAKPLEAYSARELYHKARDYENARAAAQRFLDFYPADEDAAYAQYLLALSYYDQIDLVGRDQGLTFQALQALRTVIERYPDSDYARSAILKFDLAFDHLAAKEMEIGRYYLKQGHYPAAINRFRVVVEQFQTTSHTPGLQLRRQRLVSRQLRSPEGQGAEAGSARQWLACEDLPPDDQGRMALKRAG